MKNEELISLIRYNKKIFIKNRQNNYGYFPQL